MNKIKIKVVSIIAIVCILISSATVCAQNYGKISTTLNGKELVTVYPPVYIDGNVYIPLREFATILEYDVQWIGEENAVKLTKMNDNIKLTIGSKEVVANDASIELAKEPIILNGSTYVPLSMVNKCFGFFATFSETDRHITIEENTGFISKDMVPDVLSKNSGIGDGNLLRGENVPDPDGYTLADPNFFTLKSNAVIYEGDGHTGFESLKVSATATTFGVAEAYWSDEDGYAVNLEPDTNYILSFYVKQIAGTVSGGMYDMYIGPDRLRFTGQWECAHYLGAQAKMNEWVKISVPCKSISALSYGAYFKVRVEGDSGSKGNVYLFDDFCLEKVE